MAYLDHAATTPLRSDVRDAMDPWLGDAFGNPSGAHASARRARRAIDDARDAVAAATGFDAGDVVFTGGGTESDNLAVRGVAAATGGRSVCSAVEHHAVLHVVEHLGGDVVAVDGAGRIDPEALEATLEAAAQTGPPVAVVSVMAVNNETGVINDLAAVADVVRRFAPDAVVHTDAVQALSWIDLSRAADHVDALTLSAHKLGGPQGVGVLAVKADVPLDPLFLGGGQERGRRPGTQNVAGIVGAAAAVEAVVTGRSGASSTAAAQRARLLDGLRSAVPELVETVPTEVAETIPGTLHLCIPDATAEAFLLLLEDRGVEASAASSCSSGAQQPSHVLAAMGIPDDVARGSLRLSLGHSTTDADIDVALAAVPAAVERLRMFAS